jgi:hypothetical protein
MMMGQPHNINGIAGRTAALHGLLGRAAAILTLAAVLGLMAANPVLAAAPGCPGCTYRRSITISPVKLGNSCSADLTDFPVLVEIRDTIYLRSSANGGHVANAGGWDIAFADADGNPLNHELETYDPATGTLVAWVSVPALSATTETQIYLYYGDATVSATLARPADVWDGNYQAVYHLNQAPTGAVGDTLDSTANANHAQSVNMSAGDRTDGRIGQALDFDGISDHIRLGNPLDGADAVTLSAWVKHDTLPSTVQRYVTIGSEVAVLRHNGPGGPGELHFYARKIDNDKDHLRVDDALTAGDWYYVVGTFDQTDQNLYLNGVNIASQATGLNLKNSSTSYITSGGETMDGIIDEVRISAVPRDACWIQTEYNNQRNPSGFHDIGGEELAAGEVPTYTIMAVSGPNGSITPSGEVEVDEGESPIFLLNAGDNYEVDRVSINGGPFEDYDSDQYQFINVTANGTIAVTFTPVAAGPPPDDDELPPGCSQNIVADYSGGFDPANLQIVNAAVDVNSHVRLDTGDAAIDPNSIVIPFRQEVAVTILYERGKNDETDFGWMLASEDPDANPDPHRIIYEDINDNDNNGVLDVDGDDTTDRFGDRNGDGRVDALDNREVLGTFDAGTELVFFVKVDEGQYREDKENPVTGGEVTDFAPEDAQVYHYTKTAWNQSRFTSRETLSSPELSCKRDWGDPFEKIFHLGLPKSEAPACIQDNGWMDADALDRAAETFGLNFHEDDTSSLFIDWDERWPAVMVGAPANDPNAWVLGFEDLVGGGDLDNNDVVLIIERETGGTVEIVYWLSIDTGQNWVKIDGWDKVFKFRLNNDQKILLDPVANWSPGTPENTYRIRRVDFTSMGLSGRELIWRAELKSRQEGCEPKIIDMSLDVTAAAPGHIGRATPTVLANVMYSGSLEVTFGGESSNELRGHLKTTRIYDPNDPSHTGTVALWDAGDVLKNQNTPANRTIYIPNVTVHVVDDANAEALAVGDGVTTTFSGRLAHYPVLATTVRLTDTRETFADQHTDVLDGSLGGSGWINRFTGHYRLTFQSPPKADQPIKAVYSYFTYNPGGTLRTFTEGNVLAAELGLDNSAAIPSGYLYDFDQDDAFSSADANWLINWIRGWQDGNAKLVEKEWVLGAVDHSIPAVASPPAASPWFYGTAFPEDKLNSTEDRQGYREFRDAQAGRRTVVYVGARDGMLHAFDAGVFRWGDNPCTDVGENRGYFQWKDLNDPGNCIDSCTIDCQPDYGTGAELWAFIPANLLPRLKNNLMQGDDKSFVDASPALADVHTDGAWRTVLLSAEGNGGDTIFCLDVTNPHAPKFMWEFADPHLFRSRSSPSVAQIGRIYHEGTAKWAAFFVSGKTYDDTLYPSIFALDIADGSIVAKIDLDASPAGAGGVLSGQPTIVDSDGNGYVDRLYIGSDKGLMYKINVPDSPDTVKYGLGHCIINTDFTDRDDESVPAQWHYQPIYGSPAVTSSISVDPTGQMLYDVRVFFGTGDSPYYDEDINFDDTRYLFYAYRDTTAKGQCDDTLVHLDWFFELPEGHRIYASAFTAAGNIYFGTSTGETEDPCDISANSDAGFDANAGKLYAFDMNNPTGLPILRQTVGNVLAAPVVEDQHIYIRTLGGDIDSFGAGQYNNKTLQGGIPQIEIDWWREVF